MRITAMNTPPARRGSWLGILACYVLAYGFVLLLAARKGLDISDIYALSIWLVSAFIVWAGCGLASLAITAVIGRFHIRSKSLLLVWSGVTVLIGGLLVFNAR